MSSTSHAPTALLGRRDLEFQLLQNRENELHRCFGHASRKRLRTILKNNKIMGVDPYHISLLTTYDSCQLGKSKHASAPKVARTKATVFAQRLMSANITLDVATSWVWATPITNGAHTYNMVKHIVQVQLH